MVQSIRKTQFPELSLIYEQSANSGGGLRRVGVGETALAIFTFLIESKEKKMIKTVSIFFI